MNGNAVRGAAQKLRVIPPVILRIAFCLVMWTLGAMTMTISEARTAPKAFTKQTKDSNPLLTRRAALTTPSGAFCVMEDSVSAVWSGWQFWEGW